MNSIQTWPSPNAQPVPASPSPSALTPEEWDLIVVALSAYQHHSEFRALYDKIAARQAAI